MVALSEEVIDKSLINDDWFEDCEILKPLKLTIEEKNMSNKLLIAVMYACYTERNYEMLERVFQDIDKSIEGYRKDYAVTLLNNMGPKIVIVQLSFPMDKTSKKYASIDPIKEGLMPAIIEKSLAKLHYCYDHSIEYFNTIDPFISLTGVPSIKKSYPKVPEADDLWEDLNKTYFERAFVGKRREQAVDSSVIEWNKVEIMKAGDVEKKYPKKKNPKKNYAKLSSPKKLESVKKPVSSD